MEDSYRYFENHACVYYPCHKGIEHMNCLFCFCPLYLRKDCPGNPRFFEKNGKEINTYLIENTWPLIMRPPWQPRNCKFKRIIKYYFTDRQKIFFGHHHTLKRLWSKGILIHC